MNPPPPKLNWGRWLVLAAAAAGVTLFFTLGPSEATVIARSAGWRAQAQAHLPAALAVFFVAEVVLVSLSVPVGIWLTALAGFLFGTWTGAAVVTAAALLGATVAFLTARYVFADALHRAAARRPRLKAWMDDTDDGFRRHGAYYVLLLRMTPVIPFWFLNLALGLTAVRLRDYVWASAVGMVPSVVVVCHAGAGLAEITSFREVLSLRVVGVLCLLPLIPFAVHHTVGRRVWAGPT
jgi:uncharacterized membrane protein YdjX (TVP38/TMEM64 family)